MLIITVHTIVTYRFASHRSRKKKKDNVISAHTYCRNKILFTASDRVLAQREEETRYFASTSFPAIYFSSMWDLRTSVLRDLVLYAYPLDPIRNDVHVPRPLLDLWPPRIEETIDSARMHLRHALSPAIVRECRESAGISISSARFRTAAALVG